MSAAAYLAGVVALVLITAPWVWCARTARLRLIPAMPPVTSVVCDSVVTIGGILVVSELVGVAGWFSRWVVALTTPVVAVVAGLVVRRLPQRPASTPSAEVRPTPAEWIAVAVCVLGVTAVWAGRLIQQLHTGPDDVDSLAYHLPAAASFAQSHSLAHLRYFSPGDATPFYPFNSELLDAIAMLGPAVDFVAVFLNLGFAWLTLAAAWAVGARRGWGAGALAGMSVVLLVPLLGGSSSGTGLNDIPALAFLLCGCALWSPGASGPLLAVAGLAWGLSAGTKLTSLPAVAVLAVAAVVLASGRRRATSLTIAIALFVGGGFWYLRDWVTVGSPVPTQKLGIGSVHLPVVPEPVIKGYDFTVAHYLSHLTVMREWMLPEVNILATRWWPLLAALSAVGVVAALAARGRRDIRAMAVAAVVSFGVYLVTPTTALGPPGQPLLFGANMRYNLPGFALGFVLLPVVAARWRLARSAVTVGLAALATVLLAHGLLWQFADTTRGWGVAVVVTAGLAVVVAWKRRLPHWPGLPAMVAVAVVAGGWWVARDYLDHRYAGGVDARSRLFASVQQIRHSRVAVNGFPLEYPLRGPRLDNDVVYLGVPGPHHTLAEVSSCQDWQRLVVQGRFAYVVTEERVGAPPPRTAGWTAAMSGAERIAGTPAGAVWDVTRASPGSCPSAGGTR